MRDIRALSVFMRDASSGINPAICPNRPFIASISWSALKSTTPSSSHSMTACSSVSLRWGCRSEEHTSELQSPCNLVCRLLLEKKKHRRPCYAHRELSSFHAKRCHRLCSSCATPTLPFVWPSPSHNTFPSEPRAEPAILPTYRL